MNALDGPNCLNYTLWTYVPDNSHEWGDLWWVSLPLLGRTADMQEQRRSVHLQRRRLEEDGDVGRLELEAGTRRLRRLV